jgi:hypothetical protein
MPLALLSPSLSEFLFQGRTVGVHPFHRQLLQYAHSVFFESIHCIWIVHKNGGNPLFGTGDLMNLPFGLYAIRRCHHLANGRQ